MEEIPFGKLDVGQNSHIYQEEEEEEEVVVVVPRKKWFYMPQGFHTLSHYKTKLLFHMEEALKDYKYIPH